MLSDYGEDEGCSTAAYGVLGNVLSCASVNCNPMRAQSSNHLYWNMTGKVSELKSDGNPKAERIVQHSLPNELFVENQSYGIVGATNGNCSYIRLACMDESISDMPDHLSADRSNCEFDNGTNISGKDLLRFAKQIADGMVSSVISNTVFLHTLCLINFDCRYFWQPIRSCTAIWPPVMFSFAMTKISKYPISGSFVSTNLSESKQNKKSNIFSYYTIRLSRDIYLDNIYMKTTIGRLPIKWLAIESMSSGQEYTSQSDV